nr:HAD family phosphatase [Gammaproteobacteria bacterium]
NQPLPEGLFQSLSGRNAADSRRLLVENLGEDFPHEACREAMMRHYQRAVDVHGIGVMAGAPEMLAYLSEQDVPFAVATSSAAERARYKLGMCGLDHWFTTIVAGDEVENGKPAPDIFLKAAASLAAPPTSCMVFEDSYAGIRAAAAAAMRPIMVPDQLPATAEMEALSFAIVDDLHGGLAVVERALAAR